MSKLRGQGRLIVLLVVAVVAVYVFYNYMGRSAMKGIRIPKDKKVLKYHELAGKLNVRLGEQRQYMKGGNFQRPGNVLERPGAVQMQREGIPGMDRKGKPANSKFEDQEPRNSRPQDDRDEENDDDSDNAEVGNLPKAQQQQRSNRMKFSAFISQTVVEPFKMYTDAKSDYTKFLEKKERLVHLDLKGAAPKMSYLEKLIPLFSQMGATGLLIEYEDMFPYSENLAPIAAKNAYKKQDIMKINSLAEQNKLKVIPLVQTFGHMEFALKGKAYKTLRESEDNPQSITPAENESLFLIKAMIDQVFKLHPTAKFFHIGSDEVYNIGEGKSKERMKKSHLKKEDLLFSHVRSVVKIVRNLGLQPIMWDDMFRQMSQGVLEQSGLGDLVQPMIWRYEQQPQKYFPTDMWSKYGKVFKNVWVASAFKGATGSYQYVTDSSYHLENHLNWVEIMMEYGGHPTRQYLNFVGIALTGWQRYDHFATLCELLPAAMPSLAVCLQTVKNGYFDEALHRSVSLKTLQCQGPIELRLPQETADSTDCKFLGSEFYYRTRDLYNIHKNLLENYSLKERLQGWISEFNVIHNFSSPGQMNVFVKRAGEAKQRLLDLRKQFQGSMSKLFDNYTTEEFLVVKIDNEIKKLDRGMKLAKSLSSRQIWPRRPLIGQEQDDTKESLVLFNRKEQVMQGAKNLAQNGVLKPLGKQPAIPGAINVRPTSKPVEQILPEQKQKQVGQALGQAGFKKGNQFGQPLQEAGAQRDRQFQQAKNEFGQQNKLGAPMVKDKLGQNSNGLQQNMKEQRIGQTASPFQKQQKPIEGPGQSGKDFLSNVNDKFKSQGNQPESKPSILPGQPGKNSPLNVDDKFKSQGNQPESKLSNLPGRPGKDSFFNVNDKFKSLGNQLPQKQKVFAGQPGDLNMPKKQDAFKI